MYSATQEFLNVEHNEIFEQTKDIPGWQLPGDSFKLYEMAYQAGDVILEIGTFGGRSAVVELRGALANSDRAIKPQFFGIDVDFNSIWRTANTLQQAGLNQHSILFHGNLDQFVKAFEIQPTMVFVDGDHRYAGIKRDLEILADLLAPNIPVLCHDYCNPDNDTGEMGVRRAVNEFVEAGYAKLIGTFGCSVFLVTSDRCQGNSGLRWSSMEFAQQQATLYEQYFRNLFTQLKNTEAHYASQLERQIQPTSNNRSTSEIEAALKQRLEKTKTKLKQTQLELARTHTDLEGAQSRIQAMKTSKFWKIRTLWFKAKRLFGLGQNE